MKSNDADPTLASAIPHDSIPKHQDDPQPLIPIPASASAASAAAASAAAAAAASAAAESESESESHLLHRSLLHAPNAVTATSGLTLTLANGTTILDACGGAAVSCLGYNPTYLAEIAQAVSSQILTVPYVHTLTYTTAASENLASALLAGNRHGFEKAYFVGSGSEAMEAALKFARQYFYEMHDETQAAERVSFIARRQSYHGNTIGAMSVSHHVKRKEAYVQGNVLQLPGVSWVAAADYYHGADWRRGESEEEFAGRLVRELEEEILRVGKGRVVAFIAETLSGATMGCVGAPRGYWRGVRQVCDRYGVLLILDEVMCGVGRTGSFYAFESEEDMEGVRPDLVTLGKGLGGGITPIAAVVLGEKVCKGLREGRGRGDIRHGHTYQAHPVSCASSLAVLQILKRDGLVERCGQMGSVLEQLLREKLGEKKHVGNIRGRGLFWGVEFVRDKQTREPFEAELAWGPSYQQRVFEKGVAVYPGAGTVDGIRGDHVIVSPAYTVREEELKRAVEVMTAVYDEMEAELEA